MYLKKRAVSAGPTRTRRRHGTKSPSWALPAEYGADSPGVTERSVTVTTRISATSRNKVICPLYF